MTDDAATGDGRAVIATDRLILRDWTESDLAPFAEMNACPQVCEFLSRTLSKEQSDTFVRNIADHFRGNGYGLYALEVKASGTFIGFTGLSVPSFAAHFMPTVEIGWRLARAYWGQGYATEAAKAVIAHGFDRLGLREIVSFTVPANMRSRAVMEKIGLRRDGRDDFDHPKLPEGHRLRRHVLYRLQRSWRTNEAVS